MSFLTRVVRRLARSIEPLVAFALCLLLGAAGGCSSATSTGKVTLNFIDYNRGASFPSHSDVDIMTPAGDTRFHDVRLEGKSFFEDNFIIPNAFVKPLVHLDFQDALNAFTEPYYDYRFHHFFKSRPQWASASSSPISKSR